MDNYLHLAQMVMGNIVQASTLVQQALSTKPL